MDEIAALKSLLLERLRASSVLAALVSDRIYDVPPVQPSEMTSPYVRFGQFTSSDDGAECFESSDISAQIDVYSWGSGEAASTAESLKIMNIVRQIVRSLEDVEALKDGYVLSDIRYLSHRSITASDGVTKHVPITISAIVDKT